MEELAKVAGEPDLYEREGVKRERGWEERERERERERDF